MDNVSRVIIHDGVKTLQHHVHELAKAKGWWEEERGVPELLALIHSEVSEALEAYREQPEGFATYTIPVGPDGKPEGFAVELADAVIRILDCAEHLGIDLGRAILAKHAYNETRPYRHGGKRA